MTNQPVDPALESLLERWRGFRLRGGATDTDELDGPLRTSIATLRDAGLTTDEAFLIAVRRLAATDRSTREFVRTDADRLWPSTAGAQTGAPADRRELWVVLGLAVGAGIAVKAGLVLTGGEADFALNLSVLVLPFLAGYLAWKRQAGPRLLAAAALPFIAVALLLNTFPFAPDGATQILAAIHAPIVLWFVVGLAYVGGDWRSDRRRMDFVRFTGEFAIYFSLLALGGGVLVGLTAGTFTALGVDPEPVLGEWVVPFGAAGAVLVAAWLVETKQNNVVENIAPLLTRVFTPLTSLMLLALLVTLLGRGGVVAADRDLLIMMDLILVLVSGLLLYAISARDPLGPPDLFDRLQLVLVVSALAVDLLMLSAMLGRIAEFGYTPNKVTALGLNVLLLIHLIRAAWLSAAFLRGRGGFDAIERWQTGYLPVYWAWAAVVVAVVPPAFDFG
ncbi:hypothetical protein [Skermania piniformis]|uniref:DUF4153 domain-containing protein n=1 Tax=Skermania pinensis TaxID=39122 RepID=A0ABX8S8D3_9ACTN|nr:hypothetical protein [Skermania piniformis]QXQ12765.1 hypothetical protein KV203_12570 [Skermania piniformis]